MRSQLLAPRWSAIAVVVSTLVVGACKKKEGPTCSPESVDWRMQLALQSSKTINTTDEGKSLPTVIRVFQLRGELAMDDLDFEKLWEAEEADALGESFLSMEEITMYPDKSEVKQIPVEKEATHVLAAGLFRRPASTSWYTSYEIPVKHPEVVCAKAPVDKVYPNPCFYLMLDRSVLEGGATPPSGYELQLLPNLSCAPLGVSIAPEEDDKAKRKRKRQERRKRIRDRRRQVEEKPDELQRQLDGQKPEGADQLPGGDKLPDTQLPDTSLPDSVPNPDVPDVSLPDAPSLPNK